MFLLQLGLKNLFLIEFQALKKVYETFIFRKGIAQSALPYKRSVPTWQKLTADEVKETIYKLSKKGLTPSQIGVILRDSHGVNQVDLYSTLQVDLIVFLYNVSSG